MPSATPQPQLKKKASFKDRLKAWQKPPQPLEIVAEELKPRFVYEPTHAAADFSRLAVSPLSPSRQRLPPAMQILPGEEAPAVPRNSQRRPRHGHDSCDGAPRDGEPTRRHSRPSANRHSYTLVEDPFQASNAAAHVPVNARPVAWTPGTQAAGRREERPPPSEPPSQPPSDFELFIARAEAEDRERREQVLRSMSQRSATYPGNRVRPDPHRQFAAAGSSSAGRTAERSDGSGQRTSGTRYVLGSGGGVEQQRQRQERRQEGRRGHARQSSWAASYPTSGSATGNGLEKGMSPPSQPQAPAQQRGAPEPQQPIVYGIDDEFGPGREYQPQPPRTLRRQASLTQRIVQYIRPPKTAGRPVGTLVE
ncbi:hypothetical protein C8A01DRAFT_48916 [Parachaetomium inaequale]|uniref:Uncharacterized protein n=1 Tax=Parachaetomium inaequale TaxID=2588326 RepID=A0AAN6PAK0_9PEZI|nr:hypothetical protein C8A01DRAFT_48916 [Parachaetomium inaequale]